MVKEDDVDSMMFPTDARKEIDRYGIGRVIEKLVKTVSNKDIPRQIRNLIIVEWMSSWIKLPAKEKGKYGKSSKHRKVNGEEREGNREGYGQEGEIDRILELLEQCGVNLDDSGEQPED